ncbi:hydrogenase maturation protease [Thermoproteus sp. CP80]|jgi:hydrogenase maturation protease|uniref:hydrogenase maturation protease n=1 Tax=Thermoproteus sp. CP80 TaxID=1650659 RepID=UPI00074B02AC|nr:hydrogenase maturation protease [Thermoproteus sp. CP80]KUO88230.1 MAG: hydrogenase maturation protease [Thermoproteus sp. JCHS_4]PLC63146.1 hydrogenase maturation protease [Thermoproteus sp. CP80]
MERLLVVGLGNPIYGDDGLGSCLAQYLSLFNPFVLDGNAHGIGILGNLADYDVLVFIDVDANLPPGAVAVERIEGSLTVSETRLVDAHRTPPSLLVGYLRAMGKNPKAYLIAVGPKSLEPLAPASREAVEAAPAAVSELKRKVAEFGYELKVEGDVKKGVEECYKRVLRT